MSFAAFYDPRLPEPTLQRSGRKCIDNGTDGDYQAYLVLYDKYVRLRAPFLNKSDCVPDFRAPNAASGYKPIPAWEALLKKERPFLSPATFASLQAQTADIERTYNEDWAELTKIIDELAWCNYVHSFGPPSSTRILATNGTMAYVDYTCVPCLFPPPGCQTMQTNYVDPRQVGYDAKTHLETDQNGQPVQQWEYTSPIPDGAPLPTSIQPHSQMGPNSVPITLRITKDAVVAQRYRALLWAAVKGQ